MKKLLAILLVILSVGILCSCGGDEAEKTSSKKNDASSSKDKTSENETEDGKTEDNNGAEKEDGKTDGENEDNKNDNTVKEDTVQVTFKYENGQKAEVYTVNKGALAPKPQTLTPTKEHCNFVAWGIRESDGKTLKTKWNFDTDKVTNNTTIYANYTLKPDFYAVEADAAVLKGGADVRIMSFNVLAAEWASCKNTSVNSRFKYFKATVERYLPDVIGVQEFNAEWYAAIKNNSIKYKAVNASEPRLGSQYNYSTVLYNPDKVELLEYGQVGYTNSDNEKTSKITWGYFKSKSTGKKFCVTSTHWSLKNDMSIKQSPELWAKVKELTEKYSVPVICTGDFNSNDADYIAQDGGKSSLIKFYADSNYIEAKYNAKSVGLVSQTLHKGDAVTHTKGELGIKSMIDIKINQTNCVDHIMSPANLIPTYYDTVIDQDALEASDHCPIYADFKL